MVAKITSPTRVIAALNYNENKVKEGKAECLYASGYLRDAKELKFHKKLEGFERLNILNSRATTKTLHISLNFDPSESIPKEQLIGIATDYMNKIGFGSQPWLLYQHNDAGHPHIHIVTTTIQSDGKRIDTYNIGRNQSEKARKEIEQVYGLVRAENQIRLLHQPVASVRVEKIGYGKIETKKSITTVVNAVLNSYLYCSLPEFNAILKSYNVVADRGQKDGRMYCYNGLVYRVLDADGNKVSVPIKASSLNIKPTLEKLEALFEKNKALKAPFKLPLKNTIDKVLAQCPHDITSFIHLLEQKNILTVLRQNDHGRTYGITFVDRNNRCVFNGSDLGKAYSAAHLEQKLVTFNQQPVNQNPHISTAPSSEQNQILNTIISPSEEFNYTPGTLLKKKRRKKRKSIGF